jgi:ribonuclease HII
MMPPTVISSFHLENLHAGPVVGVDEVGCGPWAGPVVAGAFIFLQPNQMKPSDLSLVRDSKQLSAAQRQKTYNQLIKLESVCFSIGQASVEEIDLLNIWQATQLAMKRAISQLEIQPMTALVDGLRKPPDLPCAAIPVVKGDQICFSIAAASIIAKVTRDRIMAELDTNYPAYGWAKNAGYGTAQHQNALKLYGITPHHRRSYAPIASLLAS